MNQTVDRPAIELIEAHLAPLRSRLSTHPLYVSIKTQAHLRVFMESHVFAVLDFMSLLKALQAKLTCISLPWLPTRWPESRRFINEIVLGEESDLYKGRSVSHFELYLEAMQECDADVLPIHDLLAQIAASPGEFSVMSASVPPAAHSFMNSTFDLIRQGSVHAMAAAFTFGREDLIPDVFRKLVGQIGREVPGKLDKFIWYLERHIEVDGEDHGPLSLQMVEDLCGTDPTLWDEALVAAESAILARLAFWDRIQAQIQEI